MSQFQQFDISDFLNEIQEPLFLMDSEEIIFFNSYFLKNFHPLAEDWRLVVDDPKVIVELDEFFNHGRKPILEFKFELKKLQGGCEEFVWTFINLPSSYNSRFLIAKGTKRQLSKSQNDDLILESVQNHAEELSYMQSILNHSHDLIAILDKDGNYKFISNSVSDKLGFDTSEIIGKNYRDFAAMGSIELVKGDFFEVLRTDEEVSIDFWVRLRNGKRIYLESFAKNLLDHPQIQGIIFSSRDVTDYILTENSLQSRYKIEDLIIKLSSRLIGGNFKALEAEFFEALSGFGEFLNATRAEIMVFNKESEELEAITSWSAIKTADQKLLPSNEELRLIFENQNFLEKGKVRLVSREFGHNPVFHGLGHFRILIPMISGERMLGLIRFESEDAGFRFEEKELQVLRQLGDVLAVAFLGSQMNRRMERNENLLTYTEELSKSGSWRYSFHKNRFYCSAGFARLFGLGSQPIIEEFSSLIFRIGKQYRAAFINNLRRASSELTRTSGEFTLTGEDGQVRFISYEIEGKQEFLTQGLEVFGFCTDISHKRASESYLKLQSQILT